MMLHVTRSGEQSVPDEVMRAMFAARKAVFVDLLKWDVPVLGGAYEIDQFDDVHARYLILADREGRHLGSARLLPTMRPHLLDGFYSGLCETSPPRSHAIFEITRFCLDRALSAVRRRAVRDTLVVALADYALANGITGYVAIAEDGWRHKILGFGWRCRTLGPIARCGGQMLGALHIEISAETPALLAGAGITPLPSLVGADVETAA